MTRQPSDNFSAEHTQTQYHISGFKCCRVPVFIRKLVHNSELSNVCFISKSNSNPLDQVNVQKIMQLFSAIAANLKLVDI